MSVINISNENEIITTAENREVLWYKNAIIYQIHVRSFYDSNDDGIGDFNGLIQKLDYIQFLGVTAIWLLPFYPSPLKDEGYDISDYMNVNPIYGTLKDFKKFLQEAHRRNIKVITELVINHTSSEHSWFQKSRRAKPGSKWRNYYVWSDTPDKFEDARIIFKDFETSNWAWDPIANAYYWHRFYSHQPDLNYDNPAVQEAVFKILDFWFNLGVDGLRLDAIPYLYQREGTNCENLPETHAFLKKLNQHVEKKFTNRLLLAEANQWPDEAVAYFGTGDECHMAFHFPMMPRMYMSMQMEDRFPLIDILQQTPTIPANCQWATFLRNHDELTLEMVTDEERDYMYRMYAQDEQMRVNLGIRRRLAPLMTGDRRKIELMNSLLFSLPGTPVIYYGDEIGMGDNIYLGDRNGVRTPMQWSADQNAGFSKSTPQKLFLPVIIDPEYNYENNNVDLQSRNNASLLWWMKRIIAMRQSMTAFSQGSIEFLLPENRKIIAFIRSFQDENILVVANLSRFPQYCGLDLSRYNGFKLIELFSGNTFPIITDQPYFLTLAPYTFFWFKIISQNLDDHDTIQKKTPYIQMKNRWEDLLGYDIPLQFEFVLRNYFYHARWFKSKSKTISKISIIEKIKFPNKTQQIFLVLFEIQYQENETEYYSLPITLIASNYFGSIETTPTQAIICLIEDQNHQLFILIDAIYLPETSIEILKICQSKKRLNGKMGEINIHTTSVIKKINKEISESGVKPLITDQSNTSIIYDHEALLKLFRRIESGINPDVEITKQLTEKAKFKYTPHLLSVIDYKTKKQVITLGMIQEYIANQGDAWQYTLDSLLSFFEDATSSLIDQDIILPMHPLQIVLKEIPENIKHILGIYVSAVETIGTLTAEMHAALAKIDDASFRSETFSYFDQRSLYQSIRSLFSKAIEALNKTETTEVTKKLLDNKNLILNHAKALLEKRLTGRKIRCHGDYHLGQLLYTGKDFIVIDFEGEPTRSLSERRIKRSPLRDVAGMLRSFHYAAHIALMKFHELNTEQEDTIKWVEFWYQWICQIFLNAYLQNENVRKLLPGKADFLLLLKGFMLEKALYEINYEINNRPSWINIPCLGLLDLIGKSSNDPQK